jgi:hypothetical protein
VGSLCLGLLAILGDTFWMNAGMQPLDTYCIRGSRKRRVMERPALTSRERRTLLGSSLPSRLVSCSGLQILDLT